MADNRIRRCGRTDFELPDDKNGEGIYIGTAPEQLDENPTSVPDRSDHNRVEGNRITTPAEYVDVKEAAARTLIVDNVCRGVRDPETGGISSRGNGNRIVRNLVTRSAGAGIRFGGDESRDGIRNVVVANVLRNNDGYGVKIMRTPQRKVCGNQLARNGLGRTNDGHYHPARACRS